MTDPWLTKSSENQCQNEASNNAEESGKFEDNFLQLDNNQPPTANGVGQNSIHEPLPDSASYVKGLERKLQKLKTDSKLVDALAEKRDDCLRTLLQEGEGSADLSSGATENANLELDAPINGNGESAVQEIYRHLQPIQPVTVGETVHIVKYDQLEQPEGEEEGQ